MQSDLHNCISPLFDLVVGDHSSLSLFANDAQNRLRIASKTMSEIAIQGTNNLDIGISDILNEIKNLDDTNNENVFLEYFGKKRSHIIKKYQDMIKQIDDLSIALRLQQASIIKENIRLNMVKNNLKECSKEFKQLIASASALSDKLKNEQVAMSDSSLSKDEVKNWLARLDRKLEDIQISHIVTDQIITQINILEENNKQIIDCINSAITNTIPIWRSHVIISLNLERFKAKDILQNNIVHKPNEAVKRTHRQLVANINQHNSIIYDELKSVNEEIFKDLDLLNTLETKGSNIKKQIISTNY